MSRSKLMSRAAWILAASLVLLFGTSSNALADTYCVNVMPACVNDFPGTQMGLQAAVNAAAAHGGTDTVQIGAGTINVTSAVTATDLTDPLIITGAGAGSTIISGDAGGIAGFTTFVAHLTNVGSSVSDIGFSIANTTGGFSAALEANGGVTVHDVAVSATNTVDQGHGVVLKNGAILNSSTITVDGKDAVGIADSSGSYTVSDTTVSTPYAGADSVTKGVDFVNNTNGFITRSRFTGFYRGISVHGGSLMVADSVVAAGSVSSSRALDIFGSGTTPTLHFDHSTAYVPNSDQTGVGIGTFGATTAAFYMNSSAVVVGDPAAISLLCAGSATGTTTVSTSYSAFDSGKWYDNPPDSVNCTGAHDHSVELQPAVPGFINAATGDFTYPSSSPLMDAGDPAGGDPGETDILGGERVGNGRIDIGAWEYSDAIAPTDGSLDYNGAITSSTGISVTFTHGTDAVGVHWKIERRRGTLAGTTCDAYGSWSAVSGADPASPFADSGLTDAGCYQYRVVNTDPFGNLSYGVVMPSTTAARIDSASPIGGSISYTSALTKSTTAAVTFTPSTDTVSRTWTLQRRSAKMSAAVCGTYGDWAAVGAADAASPFADTGLLDATCYQYRLVTSDGVGHSTAVYPADVTSAVKVDAKAPVSPKTVTAKAAKGAVLVAWTAATDTVGIAKYQLWVQPKGSKAWKLCTTRSAKLKRAYTCAKLAHNKSYRAAVVAIDNVGHASAKRISGYAMTT